MGQRHQEQDEVLRTVKDMPKLEVKIVRYVQQRNYCPHCQKIVTNKNMPVLPHSSWAMNYSPI